MGSGYDNKDNDVVSMCDAGSTRCSRNRFKSQWQIFQIKANKNKFKIFKIREKPRVLKGFLIRIGKETVSVILPLLKLKIIYQNCPRDIKSRSK